MIDPKLTRITPELMDQLARDAFGRTAAEAHRDEVCIQCGRPPVLRSEAEQREYRLSAICGPCFDAMFPED